MLNYECLQQIEQQYQISPQIIQNTLQLKDNQTKKITIPRGWFAILRQQGFTTSDLIQRGCQNLKAAAWIIKYNQNIREFKSVDADIAKISKYYQVPEQQLKNIIQQQHNNPTGIGISGIPTSWLKILQWHGFDQRKIFISNFYNIAAAGWILAYQAKYYPGANDNDNLKNLPINQNYKKYYPYFLQAANQYRVPLSLMLAIGATESGFNPNAVSDKGAVGIMQFIRSTARRYGVKNRRDPQQSILGAARYLRALMLRFDGNLSLVEAAYNAGSGAVIRYGNNIPPYKQTINYVKIVNSRIERYSR